MGESGIDRTRQRGCQLVDPFRDRVQTRHVRLFVATTLFVANDGEAFSQSLSKIDYYVFHSYKNGGLHGLMRIENSFNVGLIPREVVAWLRANPNPRRPAAQTCGGLRKGSTPEGESPGPMARGVAPSGEALGGRREA